MRELRCAGEDMERDGAVERAQDGVEAPGASTASHGVQPSSRAVAAPAVADPVRTDAPSAHASGVFLEMVPHEYARRHLLLALDDGTLLRTDRTPPLVVFNIVSRLGARGVGISGERIVAAEDLASRIDAAYAARQRESVSDDRAAARSTHREQPIVEVELAPSDLDGMGGVDASLEAAVAAAIKAADEDLLSTTGKPPAVRLVDLILFEAVRRGASDVHVQPTRDRTLVRYRLDGALRTVRELPASLAAAVVGRIKIMSRLDIAEQRAPQDGRASVSLGRTERSQSPESGPHAADAPRTRPGPTPPRTGLGPARVDLRVSTLPSAYGERVVIRLLDPARGQALLTLAALGMPDDIRLRLEAHAARPSGIILSTGPTGSGKTTTLYALLAWITATSGGEHGPAMTSGGAAHVGDAQATDLNALTIEDPIEYDLSPLGVSQTQADTKKGLSFAAGLRHILRQDPDVIMVGEVRDEETAKIAVQASLTGHLVLSTLHTSDAAGAVARLLDLGVEPFLVCSSLSCVLAQRLVRRLHAPCAGRGCEACLHTGFKGRTGVFELLEVTPQIRDLVGNRASAERIAQLAVTQGMRSLRASGQALAEAGLTTMAEVARAITVTEEEPQAREEAAATTASPGPDTATAERAAR